MIRLFGKETSLPRACILLGRWRDRRGSTFWMELDLQDERDVNSGCSVKHMTHISLPNHNKDQVVWKVSDNWVKLVCVFSSASQQALLSRRCEVASRSPCSGALWGRSVWAYWCIVVWVHVYEPGKSVCEQGKGKKGCVSTCVYGLNESVRGCECMSVNRMSVGESVCEHVNMWKWKESGVCPV